MTIEELIKNFEPFDLASKKSHQKKKKDNKTVQFKTEDTKNKIFCENHSHNPTLNANQCRLKANKRSGHNSDNRDNRHDSDRHEKCDGPPKNDRNRHGHSIRKKNRHTEVKKVSKWKKRQSSGRRKKDKDYSLNSSKEQSSHFSSSD